MCVLKNGWLREQHFKQQLIVGGVVAGAHGVVVAWLVSCNVVAPCALVTGLAGWLAWRLAELTLSLQIQFHQSVQLSSV